MGDERSELCCVLRSVGPSDADPYGIAAAAKLDHLVDRGQPVDAVVIHVGNCLVCASDRDAVPTDHDRGPARVRCRFPHVPVKRCCAMRTKCDHHEVPGMAALAVEARIGRLAARPRATCDPMNVGTRQVRARWLRRRNESSSTAHDDYAEKPD